MTDTPERGEEFWRNYWNTKHDNRRIPYNARPHPVTGKRLQWDVRSFITPIDFHIVDTATSLVKPEWDRDTRANACFAWILRYLQYWYDDKTLKVPEFWQFPIETLSGKVGDCEDGACLLASLIVASGVPDDWVRVACGFVEDGKGSQAGHAYCCYCRQSDFQWVPFDWCYRPDDPMIPIGERRLLKDREWYLPTWFSFTWRSAWADCDWEIDVGRNKMALGGAGRR